ncbi:MAG: PQQ-binding-like beta-propeller repeat protein, partial [Streptosporangiales bacterium]
VYALDAGNGAVVWHHSTAGAIESRPAVMAGTVFVGDDFDNV